MTLLGVVDTHSQSKIIVWPLGYTVLTSILWVKAIRVVAAYISQDWQCECEHWDGYQGSVGGIINKSVFFQLGDWAISTSKTVSIANKTWRERYFHNPSDEI